MKKEETKHEENLKREKANEEKNENRKKGNSLYEKGKKIIMKFVMIKRYQNNLVQLVEGHKQIEKTNNITLKH